MWIQIIADQNIIIIFLILKADLAISQDLNKQDGGYVIVVFYEVNCYTIIYCECVVTAAVF